MTDKASYPKNKEHNHIFAPVSTFRFYTAEVRTKDSELNGSKDSTNLISSYFLREVNTITGIRERSNGFSDFNLL